MGRPRVFIRVIELPDGSLQRTKRKSGGREINGLSFNEGNQRYYSIDLRTRKRVYHGTECSLAVRTFLASKHPQHHAMTEAEATEKLKNEVGLEDYEVTPNQIELAKEADRSGFHPSEADAFEAKQSWRPSTAKCAKIYGSLPTRGGSALLDETRDRDQGYWQ